MILRNLQEEGRLSNKELSARIGLSPSATLERTRRLEEGGVIRGYRAELEPARIGLDLRVLISVRLQDHHRETIDDFARAASALPELRQVFHLSGAADFHLEALLPSVAELERFLTETLAALPGLGRMETSLVLSPVKADGPLPLERALEGRRRSGEET